jgi:hypothetical protein
MSSLKSGVSSLMVVAALATGAVLVASYAQRPGAPAPVTCSGERNGCPLRGTGVCCDAPPCGDCSRAETCANRCAAATGEDPCAGSAEQETPSASCPMSGCGGGVTGGDAGAK